VAPGRFRGRHAADRVALAANQLRPGAQGVVTDQVLFPADEHPAACPWCGRSRIRGILPSPDGNRWYRCGACATTFFLKGQPWRYVFTLAGGRATALAFRMYGHDLVARRADPLTAPGPAR